MVHYRLGAELKQQSLLDYLLFMLASPILVHKHVWAVGCGARGRNAHALLNVMATASSRPELRTSSFRSLSQTRLSLFDPLKRLWCQMLHQL